MNATTRSKMGNPSYFEGPEEYCWVIRVSSFQLHMRLGQIRTNKEVCRNTAFFSASFLSETTDVDTLTLEGGGDS